ncbi:MAG: hypothetical protein WDN72_11055 [Alphaproteobacteria bacterium]
MTFRDKYGRQPGDWMHATDTFGILAGTGSDTVCQNTLATAGSTATCKRQRRRVCQRKRGSER